MSRDREEGQTALLVVGLFLVAVLLVVVVVDASAAYLRRQQLDSLADGAALAAADAVRSREVYEDGLGELAGLDPGLARRLVAQHLRQVGAKGAYPGLTFEVITSGDSVRVRVSAPLELPFAPPGWAERTRVSGTAVAHSRVQG